jgi:hypothetical protein
MPKTVKTNTRKVKDQRAKISRGPAARAKDAALHEQRRIENYLSTLPFPT